MDQYNDDRVALLYKMLIFVCLKFFSFLELYKYFFIFPYFIWYIISYSFTVTVKMRAVVDSAMLNKQRNDNANDDMQGNKKVKECASASLSLRKAP